jgi:hypothetical protein
MWAKGCYESLANIDWLNMGDSNWTQLTVGHEYLEQQLCYKLPSLEQRPT